MKLTTFIEFLLPAIFTLQIITLVELYRHDTSVHEVICEKVNK